MADQAKVFEITTTDFDYGKHKFKYERSLQQKAYDAKGNLTSSLELVGNLRGIKYRLAESNTYDDDGNLVFSETTKYTKGRYRTTDEVSTTRHTYDDQANKISSLIETDYDGDGEIDSSVIIRYRYDRSGKMLESQSEYDSGADGIIDSYEETIYTYDSSGRLISVQTQGDENGNGSFDDLYDLVFGITRTYDEQGNIIQEDSYSYQGFGGFSLVTDFTYDNCNRLLEEYYENFDAYGDLTSSGRNSYEYDEAGKLISLIEAYGVFSGNLTSSSSTTNSYDDAGNLTLIIEEEASYDIPYYRQTTRNTYDDAHHLLASSVEVDYEADGQADDRTTVLNTYDRRGNQVSSVIEYDTGADGVVDSVKTLQQKYNHFGHLIASNEESTHSEIVYRAIYTHGQLSRPWSEKVGNDMLEGTAQRDTLRGGAGDDWILGLGGHDLLVGNAGNDRLLGGNGHDTLRGGFGEDEFVFRKPVHKADRILDFNIIEDSILIQKSGFELDIPKGLLADHRFTIGSAARDRGDRFIFNPATGALLFDPDGTRKEAATAIAYLTPNIDIAADNILIA